MSKLAFITTYPGRVDPKGAREEEGEEEEEEEKEATEEADDNHTVFNLRLRITGSDVH